MPHGGGHHGGGGGGWGGGHHHHHHGGGGWGHHHHHGGLGRHHHHNHYGRRWGWGWGWGWGPYGYAGYYRYQRARFYRGWGICVGVALTVTLIVVLSTSLSIRYRNYDSYQSTYAQGDTRIISYSSSFCDGLALSGNKPATLYLLQKKPPLSGPNNRLTANAPSVILGDAYRYLSYYLHAGSVMNMTYCVEGSSAPTSFTFSIVKGSDNFDNWEDDGDNSHTVRQFSISNLCSTSSNKSYSYTIGSGDIYYFAFDNLGSRDVSLKATLVFHRTEYLPNSVTVKDSCSINSNVSTSGSCSVSVPYNTDYVALLRVGSEGIAPEDIVSFDWTCNARVWVYIIIVLFPLLFVTIVTVTVLTVCICYARKRSQNYTSVPAETPETATVVSTTVTMATPSAPPPANPDYSPAPPTYGATGTDGNPPPYPNKI